MQDNFKDLFIQVDESDNPIAPISRKEANTNPDVIHRSIKVLVYNSVGELLIQKRHESKDTFPDCWDVSVAGHVDWGETYIEAALREMQEEIGIFIQKSDLELIGKLLIKLPWETEFQQTYKTIIHTETEITFAEDEVSEVRFVNNEELSVMIKDKDVKWASPALKHFEAWKLITSHSIE